MNTFSSGSKERKITPLPKHTIILKIFPLLLKVKFQVHIHFVLFWLVFLFVLCNVYWVVFQPCSVTKSSFNFKILSFARFFERSKNIKRIF